ncbi:hypothetical protein KC350_g50 [Hortaea werneckii]|nr:hypothetical protein KC350_g50 [Hortaea werneckii]
MIDANKNTFKAALVFGYVLRTAHESQKPVDIARWDFIFATSLHPDVHGATQVEGLKTRDIVFAMMRCIQYGRDLIYTFEEAEQISIAAPPSMSHLLLLDGWSGVTQRKLQAVACCIMRRRHIATAGGGIFCQCLFLARLKTCVSRWRRASNE